MFLRSAWQIQSTLHELHLAITGSFFCFLKGIDLTSFWGFFEILVHTDLPQMLQICHILHRKGSLLDMVTVEVI